jgi:hypothetical protein
MQGSPGYAWEKFEQAVDCLVTSHSPLRPRLIASAMYLERLEPEDLPTPDMAEEFQAIGFALGKRPPTEGKGTLEATIEAMTDATASEVARRILDLHSELVPYRDYPFREDETRAGAQPAARETFTRRSQGTSMPTTIQAGLILVVGVLLIVLAYRWSGSTWRESEANADRLNQQWRCLVANGRPLRGASTADCLPFAR